MTSQQFKEAREKAGFTQRQLANEWGMGKNGDRTIRRWESGELTPNPIAAYCLQLMIKE